MIPVPTINQVILDFYGVAMKDILIGYHFRHIDNFDGHILRITQFWNLQLNGVIDDKSHLPFNFIELHRALKVNKGEIFRWLKLFRDTLNQHEVKGNIAEEHVLIWSYKAEVFAKKLDKFLFKE